MPAARFRDDGRLCMSNSAAEGELRAVAVGISDEDGRRAAAIYTVIATAKLNDIYPQAWLAAVLAACRIIPPSVYVIIEPARPRKTNSADRSN